MDSKQCGGIDLHIHSTASDGTNTPIEILEMATHAGLQAISITDHDTLDGSRQAFSAEIPLSVEFLTGVEISVQAPKESHIGDSLHILGYGIDPNDSALTRALTKFQGVRAARIHHIVHRLHQLGLPISLQQVMEAAGSGTAGRPHVAAAMVNAGFATDINDAFDRYLGNGRPACVPKERMDCEGAFDLILKAGGIPVLAHPYLIPCRDAAHRMLLVEQLCDLGLKGLEVYYPKHTPEAVVQYLALAEKYDLLVTGGTDFHGDLIPDIEMGRGAGDLHVPYTLFEKLLRSCPSLHVLNRDKVSKKQ